MLLPETRRNLIAELDSRMKSLQTSYDEISSAYGEIADANGIKRSHVILPIRSPSGTQSAQAGGSSYKTAAGETVSWREIQDTAKNRNISTDDVIRMLNLKPAGP